MTEYVWQYLRRGLSSHIPCFDDFINMALLDAVHPRLAVDVTIDWVQNGAHLNTPIWVKKTRIIESAMASAIRQGTFVLTRMFINRGGHFKVSMNHTSFRAPVGLGFIMVLVGPNYLIKNDFYETLVMLIRHGEARGRIGEFFAQQQRKVCLPWDPDQSEIAMSRWEIFIKILPQPENTQRGPRHPGLTFLGLPR